MIIKSMSRKAPTFGQLAEYIAGGSNAQTGTAFVRNLYASGADRTAVAGQFMDNYRYLPKRKNGNALYHEVIVLEPQGHLAPDEIATALHQLAERYCELRAPRQMAWGRVHLPSSSEAVGHTKSNGFPHIHLMISANEVRSDRRVRMERAYFANVQRELEAWSAKTLPELNARIVYGYEAEKHTPKQPNQEGEMVRRTARPSDKQRVYECVHGALRRSDNRAELDRALHAAGMKLYRRAKTWGVETPNGRRYRLRTLGLADYFDRVPEKPQPARAPKASDARAQELLD